MVSTFLHLALALSLAQGLEPFVARRAVLQRASYAGLLLPSAVGAADFTTGGAKMSAPALVASPIRPTGEMAATCEVVAMGREDVCLVPKSQLSAYNKLKLNEALEDLPSKEPTVVRRRALVNAILDGDWGACLREIDDPPALGLPSEALKSLKSAIKEKDSPAAAKAVLMLL